MISVVIRTKNEIKTIPRLIAKLKLQTFIKFEIIVVDNESTDGTCEYAKRYADKVITIKKDEFSHSRSCNQGILASSGEYIYFTNGHSFPISNLMFEVSENILNKDSNLGGLFGRAYPYPKNHTFIEGLNSKFDSILLPNHLKKFNKYCAYMQHTISCINRTQLMKENQFKEMECGAGEDSLWAMEMLMQNYNFAYSPSLDVYHSHGGSNLETIKRYWLYYRSTKEAKYKSRTK